MTNNNALI